MNTINTKIDIDIHQKARFKGVEENTSILETPIFHKRIENVIPNGQNANILNNLPGEEIDSSKFEAPEIRHVSVSQNNNVIKIY